jgi:nitroreductase
MTPTEAMNWRYATKQFDSTKKLTDEEVTTLLDLARLSPSWYGLQPWTFILVENSETRAQLREASYGQPQVTDASHFVVFAHKTTLDEAYVDRFIQSTADAQTVTPEDLAGLKTSIMGFVGNVGANPSAWAASQTHIALGVFIAGASMMGIDTAPMGGFDSAKYDEILGLKEKELHACVVCAIGHRSDTDEAATRAKSRFGSEPSPSRSWGSPLRSELEFQLPSILFLLIPYVVKNLLFIDSYG